jgi:hypothetical protein
MANSSSSLIDATKSDSSTPGFFALPLEIRNMIYASLISLSRPPESLLPFSTSSTDVRCTLGTSQVPPARQTCRQFDHELQAVMHGPCFPHSLFLELEICFRPLGMSINEILAWDEEVNFGSIPKSYACRLEKVEIECSFSDAYELDVQLEYIRYELLKEARALKEVKLRLSIGKENELDVLDWKLLPVLREWDEAKRVECVYEWRHGMRALMMSDHSCDCGHMKCVVIERNKAGWVVDKAWARDVVEVSDDGWEGRRICRR